MKRSIMQLEIGDLRAFIESEYSGPGWHLPIGLGLIGSM